MQRHTVEVLYRERCPFVTLAIDRVRAAIGPLSASIDIEIRVAEVSTKADALARRFRGSPSVRVDGVDVDPNASERPLGTHARGYVVEGNVESAPPTSWILDTLTQAIGQSLPPAYTLEVLRPQIGRHARRAAR